MPPLTDRINAASSPIMITDPKTGESHEYKKPISERIGTLTGMVAAASSSIADRINKLAAVAGAIKPSTSETKPVDLGTEVTTIRGPGASEIDKQERSGRITRNNVEIPFHGREVKDLAATVFAEAGNFTDPEKQKEEFRHIANVVINRAVKDGSISKVLSRKDTKGRHQFQGKDNPQYKLYFDGGKSLDLKKAELLNSVLEQLYTGKFEDTVDGATFFSHEGKDKLFTPDHSRQY